MFTGKGHIDVALSNLSIEYVGTKDMVLIGEVVAPKVPVKRRSDKYRVHGLEFLQRQNLTKSSRSESSEIFYSKSTEPYYCQPYGDKVFIDDDDIEDDDVPASVRKDGMQAATDVMLLDGEHRVADKFTDADNYAALNKKTLSGTSQWSDFINSTPMEDIMNAQIQVLKSGKQANTIIIPIQVAVILANHPNYKADIADKINQVEGIKGDYYTANSGLFPMLKGMRVLVATGIVNNAEDGEAASLGYIWGKEVWVGFVTTDKQPTKNTCSFMLQFRQKYKGFLRQVYTKFDPRVDIHGEWINVEERTDEKIIYASSGYLISDAVA